MQAHQDLLLHGGNSSFKKNWKKYAHSSIIHKIIKTYKEKFAFDKTKDNVENILWGFVGLCWKKIMQGEIQNSS